MPPHILDSGIEVLSYLARFRGPWTNGFFLALSVIGSIVGYIVILAILWWGFSWKLGAKLFAALVLSVYLNALVKDVIAQPRPFVYTSFESVTRPDEFSFPSGHAQHAALVWTLLAMHFRKTWFTVFAAAMVFLIGFSRVYLGVHFPTDVLAGWLAGSILAHVYVRWNERFIDWANGLPFEWKVSLAFGVPIALTLLHGTRTTAMSLGALAGTLGGLVIARRRQLYAAAITVWQRRRRLAVGLLGLPLLVLALWSFSPSDTSRLYYLHRFMQYATIGLWVSYFVPRIVSLMRPHDENAPAASAR